MEESIGETKGLPTHREKEEQICQLYNLALKRDLVAIRSVPSGKVWDRYKMVDFTHV